MTGTGTAPGLSRWERVKRRLRFKRVRVNVCSPEAWAMLERAHAQTQREHEWVHRLEDEIARLRGVIDDALLVCVNHPFHGEDAAKKVAETLRRAWQEDAHGN